MKSMKILLLLAAVIFSGFSGGSQGAKESVVIPMKFKGVIIIDPSAANVPCTGGLSHHRTGWLEGNQTHGGKLITELSTWEITDCRTASGINTSNVTGVNTVANGDTYNYSCVMVISLANYPGPLDVTLFISINGGTGRFEGATGEITLYGIHAGTGTIPVNGEGTIVFPK